MSDLSTGSGIPLNLEDVAEFMDRWRDLAHRYGGEIVELKRQIIAYQIALDNARLREMMLSYAYSEDSSDTDPAEEAVLDCRAKYPRFQVYGA